MNAVLNKLIQEILINDSDLQEIIIKKNKSCRANACTCVFNMPEPQLSQHSA